MARIKFQEKPYFALKEAKISNMPKLFGKPKRTIRTIGDLKKGDINPKEFLKNLLTSSKINISQIEFYKEGVIIDYDYLKGSKKIKEGVFVLTNFIKETFTTVEDKKDIIKAIIKINKFKFDKAAKVALDNLGVNSKSPEAIELAERAARIPQIVYRKK